MMWRAEENNSKCTGVNRVDMGEFGSTLRVSQGLFIVSTFVCFSVGGLPVHLDLTLLTIIPPREWHIKIIGLCAASSSYYHEQSLGEWI